MLPQRRCLNLNAICMGVLALLCCTVTVTKAKLEAVPSHPRSEVHSVRNDIFLQRTGFDDQIFTAIDHDARHSTSLPFEHSQTGRSLTDIIIRGLGSHWKPSPSTLRHIAVHLLRRAHVGDSDLATQVLRLLLRLGSGTLRRNDNLDRHGDVTVSESTASVTSDSDSHRLAHEALGALASRSGEYNLSGRHYILASLSVHRGAVSASTRSSHGESDRESSRLRCLGFGSLLESGVSGVSIVDRITNHLIRVSRVSHGATASVANSRDSNTPGGPSPDDPAGHRYRDVHAQVSASACDFYWHGRAAHKATVSTRTSDHGSTAKAYNEALTTLITSVRARHGVSPAGNVDDRADSEDADMATNIAAALRDVGDIDRAIEAFQLATVLTPNSVSTYANLGSALHQSSQFTKAIAAFDTMLSIDPTISDAYAIRGASFASVGRMDEATDSLHRAIELDPHSGVAYNNYGQLLREHHQWEPATRASGMAVKLEPTNALHHYNHAISLSNLQLDHLPEAMRHLEKAVGIDPTFHDAVALMAFYKRMLCDVEDERRWSETVLDALHRQWRQRQPACLTPVQGLVFPLSDELILFPARCAAQTASSIAQISADDDARDPNHHPPRTGTGRRHRRHVVLRGSSGLVRGRDGDVDDGRGRLDRDPGHVRLRSGSDLELPLHVRVGYLFSDFDDHVVGDDLMAVMEAHDVHHGDGYQHRTPSHSSVGSFDFVCISGGVTRSPRGRLEAVAAHWQATPRDSGEILDSDSDSDRDWEESSFDYRRHRDNLCDTVPVNESDDNGHHDERTRTHNDHQSLRRLSLPNNIAKATNVILNASLDILIDINGYTEGNVAAVVAGRPAPLQVAFKGYPGSMGADWIDFYIADATAAPVDFAATHFHEKLAFMPMGDTYHLNGHAQRHLVSQKWDRDMSTRLGHRRHDDTDNVNGGDRRRQAHDGADGSDSEATQNRVYGHGHGHGSGHAYGSDHGLGARMEKHRLRFTDSNGNERRLPTSSFVFCSFNRPVKIDMATIRLWARVLHSVPGSVLWQIRFDAASERFMTEAFNRLGISHDRLFFTDMIHDDQQSIVKSAADLFLDTLPYNAHGTAADALWGGIPLLTWPGSAMASRVAASILSAHGGLAPLTLIARSDDDYVEIAVRASQRPKWLTKVRNDIENRRMGAGLSTSSDSKPSPSPSRAYDYRRWTRRFETLLRLTLEVRRWAGFWSEDKVGFHVIAAQA